MSKLPISVIIPTYARPELTVQALFSVCLQTRPPDEVIVIDDASPSEVDSAGCAQDSFANLQTSCRKVADKFPHIRLELSTLPRHLGMPSALRNIGIQKARNSWLAFLDSDDVWLPEKLEKQWHLVENSKLKVLHCREMWLRFGFGSGTEPKQFRQQLASLLPYSPQQLTEYTQSLLLAPFPSPEAPLPKVVSQKKHKHPRSGMPAELWNAALKKCILGPSTLLLHKSVCQEIGYFDPTLQIAEDYEYFLRIIARFAIGYCPEYLVAKRDQMQSSSGKPIPQLSQQYALGGYSWIEPFRLVALERLLLRHASFLSPEQQRSAVVELSRKIQICLAGAEKRCVSTENAAIKDRELEIAALQSKLEYWEHRL